MIAILDYEAGNQTSVFRALAGQDIPAIITRDPEVLAKAAGVIFPGVGAAGQAMELLHRTGLDAVLKACIARGTPLLGVCLGCQILLERSDEGDTPTLGIIEGRCRVFAPDLRDEEGEPITIPHMGWNSIQLTGDCRLFAGIPADAEYYFVHGYYTEPREDLVLATTYHGLRFCSVFGRDGLWALQFHPEKSGPAGLAVLRNFYRYCQEKKHAQ